MDFENIQTEFRAPVRYTEICFMCILGIIVYGTLLFLSISCLSTAENLNFNEVLFFSMISLIMGWGVAASLICMFWIRDNSYDRDGIRDWLYENRDLINDSKLFCRGALVSVDDKTAGYNIIVGSPIPFLEQNISTRFFLVSHESTMFCRFMASSITLYLGWGINPIGIFACLICAFFNIIGGEKYSLGKIIKDNEDK